MNRLHKSSFNKHLGKYQKEVNMLFGCLNLKLFSPLPGEIDLKGLALLKFLRYDTILIFS